MEVNDKKIKRNTRLVNWTITFFLALFLIGLSAKIIDDLDAGVETPLREQFQDKRLFTQLDSKKEQLDISLNRVQEEKELLQRTLNAVIENKKAEQASFDNWVKTRDVIGKPTEDKKIMQRVNKLDNLQEVERLWADKVSVKENQYLELSKQMEAIDKEFYHLNEETDKAYLVAYQQYQIKAFFIRLLFVAPLLILGIYFVVKRRQSRYWAMYLGFSLFSLYSFFFGLLPYLPYFGGYIRFAVGIVLTLGLGYYALHEIKKYTERKRKELELSTYERAQKLDFNTIERAYTKHYCPSCGKDFLLKPWEAGSLNPKDKESNVTTHYCRYCSLELIKRCSHCNTENFAYLPYCGCCGEKTDGPTHE